MLSPRDKITVIHNGVDEKRFHLGLRDKFRALIRKQWHIPLDAPTVLFVGNGFRRKGLDRLLKAWSSPQMKDTYLVVVGDDAQAGQIQSASRGAGRRESYLRWKTGRRRELLRRSGSAGAAGSPRGFWQCGFGGLAAGLPAVVSQVVGAAEILKGKLAEGIVAHPEDPKEMADQAVGNARARPQCGVFPGSEKVG